MKTVAEPANQPNSGAQESRLLESHLPSLDGMRAISILLVIGFHAYYFDRLQDSQYGQYLGHLGVLVFFVISGLLITWLMIRERESTGTFSLKNFYIRRFLRILPVFWLLIVTVSLLKSFHAIDIRWLDIVRALTFTHNYPLSARHPAYSVWLAHTWSLSLEEQFYLVWPSLYAFLPRRFSARLTVLLAFSGPLIRIALYFMFPSIRGLDSDGFESHIDLLMAGCATAFLLDSPQWRARVRKIPVWPTLAVTSAFLFIAEPILLDRFAAHSTAAVVVNLFVPTFEAVAIALTLLAVVGGKRGVPYRLLNTGVPVFLGKLSYSLYIWQQLFLVPRSAGSIPSLLVRLLALSLVAYCSFNFLEKPFVKLRGKFRHGVAV